MADDERDWLVGGPSWIAPDLGAGLKFCIWRQHAPSGRTEWLLVPRGWSGSVQQEFRDRAHEILRRTDTW